MDFTIPQGDLDRALTRVQMGLGVKDDPYLFLFEKGTLYVLASSDGMVARTRLVPSDINAEEEEMFTVTGQSTKQWVHLLPEGSVSVTVAKGKASFKCGTANTTRKAGTGRDFPRIDNKIALARQSVSLSLDDLKSSVEFVKVFATKEDGLSQFQMASSKSGVLRAADGRMIGLVFLDGMPDGINIHLKMLPKVSSFLSSCEGAVTLHFGDTMFFLEDQQGSLLGFPGPSDKFPTVGMGSRDERLETDRWTVSREDLRTAIQAVDLGAPDEEDTVNLQILGHGGDASLRLFTDSSVNGGSNEWVVPDVVREVFARTEVWGASEDEIYRKSTTISKEIDEMTPGEPVLHMGRARLLKALGAFKEPTVTLYYMNTELCRREPEEGSEDGVAEAMKGLKAMSPYLSIAEKRGGASMVTILRVLS